MPDDEVIEKVDMLIASLKIYVAADPVDVGIQIFKNVLNLVRGLTGILYIQMIQLNSLLFCSTASINQRSIMRIFSKI